MQNIPEDPKYEPWRDAALERGYRSSAAVPLVHDGELYGVLNLYADRSHAFDEKEKEIVEELAADIAFAERALREHDELETTKRRYDAVFEDPNTLTGLLDSEGRLMDANQKARSYLEGDIDEVIGEPFWETPWWSGVEDEMKEKVLRAAEGEYVEYEVEHSGEGTKEYVSSGVIYPVEDDSGEVRGLFVLSHDVTERREWESGLRRYEAYVNSTTDIITHLDDDGTVLYNSPSVEEVLGVEQDEWIGENVFDYVHPEDRENALETFTELIENEDYTEEGIELRLRHDDGSYVWLDISGRYEPVEEIDGVLLTSSDITERKERERGRRNRLRAIEKAPVGITVSEAGTGDNPLIYINEQFEEVTGYTEEEALGRDCRFLQGEDTDPEPVRKMREAIESEETVDVELLNYRKDGTEFWNRVAISPVFDDDGKVVNYVGYQQDVTERKEREQHMLVIDRVLRHNLRNDLNVVLGYAQTLAELGGEDAEKYADGIAEKCEGLLEKADKERRITEILTESLATEDIDVSDTVRHVVDSVRRAYPEAEIEVDLDETATLHVSTRFEEAIAELVRNAVVHNDSETPKVTVSAEAGDGVTAVRIEDNGPLIPRMEVDVLTDEGEDPLYHGSGLGLWFVHWVVRRSNGTLSFEENEPRGNVVTVTVRRNDTEERGKR